MLRFVVYGFVLIWLFSGCSHVRTIPVPESEGEWTTAPEPTTGRMYVRRDEGKYVIKDEPYSIKSKKKDPELLGPQRTYTASAAPSASTTARPARSKSAAKKMTKSECISLIGESKYNAYVQKYGGEKGALRRCLILKRLRG